MALFDFVITPPPPFFFSLCIVVTLAFLAGGVVSNGEALAKLQTSSERFLQWWGNALAESNLLSGKATNGIVDLVALNRKLDAQIAAGIWRWQEAHLFSTLELFSGYRSFHFAFVCYNCFYSVLPSKVRAVVRVRANLFLHVSVLLGLSFLKDSSFTGAPVFRSSCLKFVNKLTAEYAVWDTSFLALSRTAFNEDSCCFIRPDCLLLSSIF